MIGVAGCSSVRPSITAPAWRRAWAARRRTAAASTRVGVGEARLQAQDQRGIEHVLARRAVVHEGRRARVGARDLLGEGFDQRNRQRAGLLALGGQRVGRQTQLRARGGDDPGGVRRDDTGVGLGGGQRALEVEHGAHERLGGERLDEGLAGEAAADDVHDPPPRTLGVDEHRLAAALQPDVPAIDRGIVRISRGDQRAEAVGIGERAGQGIVLDRVERGQEDTRLHGSSSRPRAKIVTLIWGAYVSPLGPLNEPGTTVSIA